MLRIPIAGILLASLATPSVLAQDRTLTVGEPATASIAPDTEVAFTIEAGSEHFVRGSVAQTSADVSVEIRGPKDERLARFDDHVHGEERFHFETRDEGSYRIVVKPVDDSAGDFAIELTYLEPAADDPAKLADQLMAPYDHDDAPGAVVSVFRDGRTVFAKAYGMANLAYGIPFEVDTPTNIGSTSKQFTAFAVLLLCERGRLGLDDDVREHIPELPDFGETVTVRHLLTHTTGYREFLNLLIMTGRRIEHGDHIGRPEILESLQRQPALQNAPGAEFNYNNSAFSLAATLVERISGSDFPTFMRENVFEPLGMTRTMVRPSPEHIVPGRAIGYRSGPDGYLESRDLWGAMGAGAIYSTVTDLQKWIDNFISPTVGNAGLIAEMMTPYTLTSGESTGYGLGLFIDEQGELQRVQHGGADSAHRSQLVYFPEIKAGITTQSNFADFDGSIAFRLAGAFFADEMEEETEQPIDDEDEAPEFDPELFDPADFDEFVGRYALEVQQSFVLTFSRDGDKLLSQAVGQQQVELVPTSESDFEVVGIAASLSFQRNEDGEVDAVILHQGGRDLRANRLSDDDEWKPTADDLAEFAGRYFSAEIETFYGFEVIDDQLVLKLRRREDLPLQSGARDAFLGANMEFTFERDRNGQIIGFYVGNSRTRDVRFARVE